MSQEAKKSEKTEKIIERPEERLQTNEEKEKKTEEKVRAKPGQRPTQADLLDKLIELETQIGQLKELYAEYDHCVEQLRVLGFDHAHYRGLDIQLVDNFSDKNTAFKACFIKRYELKIKEPKTKKEKK